MSGDTKRYLRSAGCFAAGMMLVILNLEFGVHPLVVCVPFTLWALFDSFKEE